MRPLVAYLALKILGSMLTVPKIKHGKNFWEHAKRTNHQEMK